MNNTQFLISAVALVVLAITFRKLIAEIMEIILMALISFWFISIPLGGLILFHLIK